MAAAAAFGANAVADAALPVPRTAKAHGIGPGRHVSAPRYIFGEEWARKQPGGRTVRVCDLDKFWAKDDTLITGIRALCPLSRHV